MATLGLDNQSCSPVRCIPECGTFCYLNDVPELELEIPLFAFPSVVAWGQPKKKKSIKICGPKPKIKRKKKHAVKDVQEEFVSRMLEK